MHLSVLALNVAPVAAFDGAVAVLPFLAVLSVMLTSFTATLRHARRHAGTLSDKSSHGSEGGAGTLSGITSHGSEGGGSSVGGASRGALWVSRWEAACRAPGPQRWQKWGVAVCTGLLLVGALGPLLTGVVWGTGR
jgi:hypothetical protein